MNQLMFTPTGVCFNCLNGRHDICGYLGCKCSARDHKQWWFRDDGIDNELQALRRDGFEPPLTFEFPAEPRLPFMAELTANFWKNAPPDLQAAMIAGCEMTYDSKMTPEGMQITVATKNKIGVVRENGRVTVYEQPDHERR